HNSPSLPGARLFIRSYNSRTMRSTRPTLARQRRPREGKEIGNIPKGHAAPGGGHAMDAWGRAEGSPGDKTQPRTQFSFAQTREKGREDGSQPCGVRLHSAQHARLQRLLPI